MRTLLRVDELTRRSPHQGGGISFELGPGQVMGLIGPHHSGKNQIISYLAGLARPPRGSVEIVGRPISAEARGLLGYIPPHPGLFEEMTCREYLDFFARSFLVPEHYRPYLVREALQRVELIGQQNLKAHDLTPLERMRLSLARGVVHDPCVLIVNNIFAGLDVPQIRILVEDLLRIRQQGKALVISATSLRDLKDLVSHVCLLVTDKPLACGEMAQILPRLGFLKMKQIQFLGGFGQAVRHLEQHNSVYHLSLSTQTHNLVRFLFDSQHHSFDDLLEALKRVGCSIVGVTEDSSFLGVR